MLKAIKTLLKFSNVDPLKQHCEFVAGLSVWRDYLFVWTMEDTRSVLETIITFCITLPDKQKWHVSALILWCWMESVAELLTHTQILYVSLSNICSCKARQCGKCLIKPIRSGLDHCQGLAQGKSLMLQHWTNTQYCKVAIHIHNKNCSFKVECSIVVFIIPIFYHNNLFGNPSK